MKSLTYFRLINQLVLLLLFQKNFCQTPTIEYYKNGQDGIELIYKTKTNTTIISTYNSKILLKKEIAENLYKFSNINPETNDSIIKIATDKAIVTGSYKVSKNDNLKNVNFSYQRIEWETGLIEEHLE